jgi:MFS_1 like family
LQPVRLLCITQVHLTGYKEYGLAFAIGAAAALFVAPVIWKLDIQVQKNNQSLIKTARAVGKMLDVNVFLLVEMVVGLCWGFHFNFLAIYLNTEMKASKTILGEHLCRLIKCPTHSFI